jgi:hypothetical protein
MLIGVCSAWLRGERSAVEVLDQLAEGGGDLREILDRAQHIGRAGRGAVGGLGHAGDVLGDLRRALGGLRDVAADLGRANASGIQGKRIYAVRTLSR